MERKEGIIDRLYIDCQCFMTSIYKIDENATSITSL